MNIKLKPLDYGAIACMLLYAGSATVTPICLLAMADELNFSLSAGGGIEGVRSMLIFVSLFFGGFMAAKVGKVRSLTTGLFGLSLGYLVYAIAPSYSAILGATVILGLSSGILEGLINPLVADTHPGDSGRYLNITNAFWSVGVLTTVILAGDLLTRGISWRSIIAFLSACSFIVGIAMYFLRKQDASQGGLTVKQVLVQYRDCIKVKRFWVFCAMMVFAGGAEGAFTFWSASYIQVNFAANPRMGGFGTAFFAAGMMAVRLIGGMLVGQKYLRRFILISAGFGCVVAFAIPFVETVSLFFIVLFLAGMSIACFWPSIQSYAVDRIPQIDSTAAFILMSCAGVPGFGLASFAMGFIGDAVGLGKSFFIVPTFLLILVLLVIIERNAGSKSKGV